jgi:succinate dehydrogenase / fumarate reductase cytochrome b subunit
MTDVRDALLIARNSEGKLVRRPISPHLQVYRWPVSMASSILNRATGIALSVGTLLMVWWLVAAASSPQAYDTVSGFIRSPIGLLLMFGWTASLFYHLLNGIRHLVWDAGKGFDLPTVNSASWAIFGATAVLAVLAWIVGLIML